MIECALNWMRQIAQTIYEKKGTNITAIDVRTFSSTADYVLIATGNVDKHVIFLGKEIENVMNALGQRVVRAEGLRQGDWVVLDYFYIMIHLFVPEMRQRYQLERLWKDGQILTLDLHR